MKILVIGDCLIDHYIYAKTTRQSPEDKTIPVYDIEKEEYKVGGALNTALNLKSLSNSSIVSFSGIISTYATGIFLNNNILLDNCYYVVDKGKDNKLSTTDVLLKTRLIDIETNKQFVRIDNRKKYSDELINRYYQLFKRININEYDGIVISDYDKGIIYSSIVDNLFDYNGMVFVDTKKKDLSIWSNIENCIIKINEKEYLEIEKDTDKSIKNLIITLGCNGAKLIEYGKTKFELSVDNKIKNPDPIGAGDTFLSGFVSYFLKTNDFMESIRFANLCASKSVQMPGTSVVSYDEILGMWSGK